MGRGYVAAAIVLALIAPVAVSPAPAQAADPAYVTIETACILQFGNVSARAIWAVTGTEGTTAEIVAWTNGTDDGLGARDGAIAETVSAAAGVVTISQTLTVELTDGAQVDTYEVAAPSTIDCSQTGAGYTSRDGLDEIVTISTGCLPNRPAEGFGPARKFTVATFPSDGAVSGATLTGFGGLVVTLFVNSGVIFAWSDLATSDELDLSGVLVADVALATGGTRQTTFDIDITIRCGGEAQVFFGPGSPGRFVDDDGSVFEEEIEWLAEQGITLGCNSDGTLFCPGDPVSRAQMGSFLARALELTPVPGDRFDDVSGTHEANINAIADAGITLGCNSDGTLFCPGDTISRAQMGSFLARALGLTPVPGDRFDDVSGTHEANINAIADAGITLGCNSDGTLFCPGDPVTRGQMAGFLFRALAEGA